MGNARVGTLELFFDLVFVFTVTRLVLVLEHEPDAAGVAKAALMLLVIFWMYGGYAWLTNHLAGALDDRRILLLGGMAGFLVVGLGTERAFDGTGLAFGIGYAVVILVHLYGFRTLGPAIMSVAPHNLGAAALVLAGGIAGGSAQYVLWAAAAVVVWVLARFSLRTDFSITPSHFVERHGLVVLIALGESVVAIGEGAEELALDVPLVAVALLALGLNAALWWVYFGGGDDDRAEAALAAAPDAERSRLGLVAFGHWHVVILFGIVAAAAGIHAVTEHPFDALELGPAAQLGGGIALFLLGDVLFRRVLGLGANAWRLAALGAALVTVPLGVLGVAAVQLALLLVVLAAALALERRPRLEVAA